MVWERIEELERQEIQQARRKAAQEEADRIRLAKEATDRAQQKERERIRELEEARRLTKEVLEKSGALPVMREIDKGLEGKVRKHAIVLNGQRATLAWGSKFMVTVEGGITYESSWLTRGKMDYSYISAEVNLLSQSVTIGHKEVKKDQWSTNRAVIQDLLAQAYLHPTRVNLRETPPPRSYSSSSSGSSGTECCNH